MKIGIVAGEPSGDLLGASLIKGLQNLNPNIEITGVGGPAMIDAGCDSLFDMSDLSVMGLIEPLLRLPTLLRRRREIIQYFLKIKPDVFIGIDSPDFNLTIELLLRQAGIKTVHYVSPSVWAWRRRRIHKIRRAVDLMLTLFPFEKIFYEKNNVPVRYVGHPLADVIPLDNTRELARKSLCLMSTASYVALLPGSRKQELDYLTEPFLLAAKECFMRNPTLKFLTAQINAAHEDKVRAVWQRLTPDLPLSFYKLQSREIMSAADAVLVASGTAALETMLCKTPMVIAYRMNPLTYHIVKRLVQIPRVGLPNILANKLLVPELIQEAATPAALSQAIMHVLSPEITKSMFSEFKILHEMLKLDSAHCAANAVMNLAHSSLI